MSQVRLLGVSSADHRVRLAVERARASTAPSRGHTGLVLHRHPVLSLLTGGYLAFVAWVTLTPQAYAAERIAIIYRVLDALHQRGYLLSINDEQLEFLANIALFVPVGGFLLLLLGPRLWGVALAVSFAMTAFIEVAQRTIPGRVPDEQDVLANGLGAFIGVGVTLVLMLPAAWRRSRRRQANAALEVPVPAG
jgi:VanZ family protein